MINADYVIDIFNREAKHLDLSIRQHPLLGKIMRKELGTTQQQLKDAYCRWLRAKSLYVAYTTPMLRAAGLALQSGSEEDQTWSKRFLEYEQEETDQEGGYGHEIWAVDDMKVLGASQELITAPPSISFQLYGNYFVTEARKHPYAILGAKGVLEHLSIINAEDFEAGLLASSITNMDKAMTFIKQHGVLDIEHVKEGDELLRTITDPDKLHQVLQGACFTGVCYRSFLDTV